MNRCFNCLEELDGTFEICPHCGQKLSEAPVNVNGLAPGTLLNSRYMVGKVLGQGGFGITYSGWDEVLKRKIAIKEYYPTDLASRQMDLSIIPHQNQEAAADYDRGLVSFIDEAVRLARFQDSSVILNIFDCFKENHTAYIIMELLEGSDLKVILQKRPDKRLPYSEAKRIILKVLEALAKVHGAGIVHRDVSPANIFITNRNEVKLIDFGAARSTKAMMDSSKGLSVILKVGYAPIEQYDTHGNQGPWTDIYAAGATFYRMITGEIPPESIQRLMNDRPIRLPSQMGIEIPLDDERALLQSLELRPEKRFHSAQAFARALESTAGSMRQPEQGYMPPYPNTQDRYRTEPLSRSSYYRNDPASGYRTEPVLAGRPVQRDSFRPGPAQPYPGPDTLREPVTLSRPDLPPQRPPRKKKGKLLLILLFAAAALVIALVGLYIKSQGSGDPEDKNVVQTQETAEEAKETQAPLPTDTPAPTATMTPTPTPTPSPTPIPTPTMTVSAPTPTPLPVDTPAPAAADQEIVYSQVSSDHAAFYGVFCEASTDRQEIENRASYYRSLGYNARVILTSEWSALNPDPWYAISLGTYSSEYEANDALAGILGTYGDAYVKYTGYYQG